MRKHSKMKKWVVALLIIGLVSQIFPLGRPNRNSVSDTKAVHAAEVTPPPSATPTPAPTATPTPVPTPQPTGLQLSFIDSVTRDIIPGSVKLLIPDENGTVIEASTNAEGEVLLPPNHSGWNGNETVFANAQFFQILFSSHERFEGTTAPKYFFLLSGSKMPNTSNYLNKDIEILPTTLASNPLNPYVTIEDVDMTPETVTLPFDLSNESVEINLGALSAQTIKNSLVRVPAASQSVFTLTETVSDTETIRTFSLNKRIPGSGTIEVVTPGGGMTPAQVYSLNLVITPGQIAESASYFRDIMTADPIVYNGNNRSFTEFYERIAFGPEDHVEYYYFSPDASDSDGVPIDWNNIPAAMREYQTVGIHETDIRIVHIRDGVSLYGETPVRLSPPLAPRINPNLAFEKPIVTQVYDNTDPSLNSFSNPLLVPGLESLIGNGLAIEYSAETPNNVTPFVTPVAETPGTWQFNGIGTATLVAQVVDETEEQTYKNAYDAFVFEPFTAEVTVSPGFDAEYGFTVDGAASEELQNATVIYDTVDKNLPHTDANDQVLDFSFGALNTALISGNYSVSYRVWERDPNNPENFILTNTEFTDANDIATLRFEPVLAEDLITGYTPVLKTLDVGVVEIRVTRNAFDTYTEQSTTLKLLIRPKTEIISFANLNETIQLFAENHSSDPANPYTNYTPPIIKPENSWAYFELVSITGASDNGDSDVNIDIDSPEAEEYILYYNPGFPDFFAAPSLRIFKAGTYVFRAKFSPFSRYQGTSDDYTLTVTPAETQLQWDFQDSADKVQTVNGIPTIRVSLRELREFSGSIKPFAEFADGFEVNRPIRYSLETVPTDLLSFIRDFDEESGTFRIRFNSRELIEHLGTVTVSAMYTGEADFAEATTISYQIVFHDDEPLELPQIGEVESPLTYNRNAQTLYTPTDESLITKREYRFYVDGVPVDSDLNPLTPETPNEGWFEPADGLLQKTLAGSYSFQTRIYVDNKWAPQGVYPLDADPENPYFLSVIQPRDLAGIDELRFAELTPDPLTFAKDEEGNPITYTNLLQGYESFFTDPSIGYAIKEQQPTDANGQIMEAATATVATIDPVTGELTPQHSGVVTVTATIVDEETANYRNYVREYTIEILRGENSGFRWLNESESIVYVPSGTQTVNTLELGFTEGTVTYESSDETIAVVDANGAITTIRSGTVAIKAIQNNEALGQYLNTEDIYLLTVTKAVQTGLRFALPTGIVDGTYNFTYNQQLEGLEINEILLNAEGGESISEYLYSVDNPDVASVEGNLLTVHQVGVVRVTATKPADERYQELAVHFNLIVSKFQSSVSFTESEITLVYNDTNEEDAVNPLVDAEPERMSTGGYLYEIVPTDGDNQGMIVLNPETGEVTLNDLQTGFVVIKGTHLGDHNYSEASDQYTLRINWEPTPETPITIPQTANENGWYNQDVQLIPTTGYEINEEGIRNSDYWNDEIVIRSESGDNQLTYHLRNENGITEVINSPVIPLDKTAPTNLNISYRVPTVQQVLQWLSFNLYKARVEVTLTAEDAVSGLASFTYEARVGEDASESNVGIAPTTVAVSGNSATHTFLVEPPFNGQILFSAKDRAGNVANWVDPDDKQLIVDALSPEVSVAWSAANRLTSADGTTDVGAPTDGVVAYYGTPAVIGLSVLEANFLDTESESYPTRRDMQVTLIQYDAEGEEIRIPYVIAPAEDSDERQLTWTESTETEDLYTTQITIAEEGRYRLEFAYTDPSGNPANWDASGLLMADAAEAGTYLSNVFVVDTTAPTTALAVTGGSASNGSFYNQAREIVLTVTDANFRASDVMLNVSRTSSDGSVLDAGDALRRLAQDSGNWSSNGNRHTARFTVSQDGYYSLGLQYQDLAKHTATPKQAEAFSIDRTAPALSSMSIRYSSPVLSRAMEGMTFGFYQAPLTVTLRASDPTSQIAQLVASYPVSSGVSTVNDGQSNFVLSGNALRSLGDNQTVEASFRIDPQYRGQVRFYAVDFAGNQSPLLTDTDDLIIADSLAPRRTVSFTPQYIVNSNNLALLGTNEAQNGENGSRLLLYNQGGSALLSVTEENFYGEDVQILWRDLRAGTTRSVPNASWTQNGDTWSRALAIQAADNGSLDGRFALEVRYTDRSSNQMNAFISDPVIVDTTAPTIQIAYSPANVVTDVAGRNYYAAAQTATVTVVERNFRASDFALQIQATDEAGTALGITDFAAQLRNPSNWSTNGDTHQASFTLGQDGNYVISAAYTDMAGNPAAAYTPNLVSVDQTAPVGLGIAYSPALSEGTDDGTATYFYQDGATITLTAQDDITGVEYFTYELTRATGASGINAASRQGTIARDQLTYSEGGRVATATVSLPGENFHGTVSFTAYDRAGQSTSLNGSHQIIVDPTAPTSSSSTPQAVQTRGGKHYYSSDVIVNLTISEANFVPADAIVSLSTNGSDFTEIETSSWQPQGGDTWTTQVHLQAPADGSRDAEYQIQLNYRDRSGNDLPTYQSDILVVDTISPVMNVTNIRPETAYKQDDLSFAIQVEDVNMDPSMFNPVITLLTRDEEGRFLERTITGDVEVLTEGQNYEIVIPELTEDGLYTITASATDLAGNKTETVLYEETEQELDTASFSVNRAGSIFEMDNTLRSNLEPYYLQSLPGDIILSEISVDYLKNQVVMLNGEELVEGEDYQIVLHESPDTWKRYEVIIFADNFSEDNVYELTVRSEDATDTVAYSDVKGLLVNFAIDTTAPVLSISGVEDNGRYASDRQLVTILPQDDGGRMEELVLRVLRPDGQENQETIVLRGAELQELLANQRTIDQYIENGVNLTVEITAKDSAGNEAFASYDNVTVSTDWFVLWYTNTPLFATSIVLAAGLIGFLFFLLWKRNKKDEEEGAEAESSPQKA